MPSKRKTAPKKPPKPTYCADCLQLAMELEIAMNALRNLAKGGSYEANLAVRDVLMEHEMPKMMRSYWALADAKEQALMEKQIRQQRIVLLSNELTLDQMKTEVVAEQR